MIGHIGKTNWVNITMMYDSYHYHYHSNLSNHSNHCNRSSLYHFYHHSELNDNAIANYAEKSQRDNFVRESILTNPRLKRAFFKMYLAKQKRQLEIMNKNKNNNNQN